MLTPSIGFWSMPFTPVGSGTPMASRMVGAMSMRWWNCGRMPPWSLMRSGQEITADVLQPPPEVTVLP
jgi:hypothetical protein